MFIFMQKKYLILTSFLKFYKNIADLLFFVHWACLVTPFISNSTTLQETLMFIYKKKINLITHFSLEILHFKEPGNLNFKTRILQRIFWSLPWKVKNSKNYHFALFWGKSNDNIFKKFTISYFGSFLPKFRQNEFSTKICISIVPWLYTKN